VSSGPFGARGPFLAKLYARHGTCSWSPSMVPAVGSIVANRFELVRELGHGSMGSVWLAEHLTLDVRCAVKFMTNEARRDPNYAARFELEARTIAQLQSPNVVRVLDYDFDDGVPFIAMECLQGEDLGARLERCGRLDAPTTHRILTQVARGLDKAHAAGVIHRDLKPENIFLAQEDDGEIAKLLDFGIAKLTGLEASSDLASATLAGTLLGTPVYMSPEQVRAVGDLDHRADLWSLAVIAFECLTGQLPFQSPTLGDLFAKILFEPIPVPSQVDPTCTPAFDRWWARAASRSVGERFASAPELVDALGRALGLVGDGAAAAGAASSARPPRAGDAQGPDSLTTLRSSYEVHLPPARRERRSKLAIAGLAVVLAPLAIMLSSASIDAHARSANVAAAAPAADRANPVGVAAAAATASPVPRPPEEAVVLVDEMLARSAKSSATRAPFTTVPRARARSASAGFSPSSVAHPGGRPASAPTTTAPVDDADFGF
jgi:serine/threonine protein kinase